MEEGGVARHRISSSQVADSSPSEALVSVIVVTFKGAKYIEDCLSSLMAQTYPRTEIIVVDNASPDGTSELVQEHFPSVLLLRNTRNLGFAAANNRGIQESRGDYVALLNQDAKADAHWLEQLVKAASSDPKVGMSASKVLYLDEPTKINSTGILLYKDLSTVNRAIGERDEGRYDQVEEVFGAYGAAALYKRALLEEVGGFDEDYFLLHEEDDLAWRARFVGWRCLYVPTAVVYHLPSSIIGRYSTTKLYYGERNRLWNVVKFLPTSMIIRSIVPTLARYSRMAVLRLRAGHPKVRSAESPTTGQLACSLVRAWIDALIGLPRTANKRRQIWRARKVSDEEIGGWLAEYSATLSDVTEK